ncbi:hypothetical protein SeMB42_g06385, partial [Synchytrium endobioticum]
MDAEAYAQLQNENEALARTIKLLESRLAKNEDLRSTLVSVMVQNEENTTKLRDFASQLLSILQQAEASNVVLATKLKAVSAAPLFPTLLPIPQVNNPLPKVPRQASFNGADNRANSGTIRELSASPAGSCILGDSVATITSTTSSTAKIPSVVNGPRNILPLLDSCALLADLSPECKDRVMYGAYELHRRAGEFILQAGDSSFEMYFILDGQVDVINADDENMSILSTLASGSFFGEIGMLFGTSRTASVQAKTDCTLVVVTKQKLDDALARFPDMRARVSVLTAKKAEWWNAQKYIPSLPRFGAEFVGDISRQDVRKLHLFRNADEAIVDRLAMTMQPQIYAPHTTIIAHGTPADCMFFIVRGTVQVLAPSGTVTSEMTSGQFFGEIGVLLSTTR